MDLESYRRWYDDSWACDAMFLASDTAWAPWYAVHSDDKRKARLNIIRHILDNIRHETAPREKVSLPKRQKRSNEVESQYPFRFIAESV